MGGGLERSEGGDDLIPYIVCDAYHAMTSDRPYRAAPLAYLRNRLLPPDERGRGLARRPGVTGKRCWGPV